MKTFSVNYCLPSLPFPQPPPLCFNSPVFKAMMPLPDSLKTCHAPSPTAGFPSGLLLAGKKIEAAHDFLQKQRGIRTSYKQWGI